MKERSFARRAVAAAFCALLPAWGAHAGIVAQIDLSAPGTAVSPYEYGMFIEPIGGLLTRGLWAEMLDDRKFYFPVAAEGKDPKQPDSAEGRPAFVNRKWRPIGPDSAVTMDRSDAYVGTQSVRVALTDGVVSGFRQGGLALAQGKDYVGHIVLRGAESAKVSVTLAWGDLPGQRQTVTLSRLGKSWRSLPFSFRAGADSTDAYFEITGSGSGSFSVGTVSLMPADNIEGWRPDTIALLKSLHSGFWRLPGGNFLSNWDWHLAIGPRDKRPPVYDHAWSAMQPNDVGMDDYMTLTRLLGIEPYVTVNAGLGDAHSAGEEVEYLNGAATSEWGAKRAAFGHPAPYGIKFWNIGNEPYGWWQIGKTSLDYFMIKHRDFAAAMRAADPSITLIASGAMPDQLHPKDAKENPSLESIQHKFGTEEDWTGGLLSKAWGDFDGISEHWYDRVEKRPGASPDEEMLEFVRSPSNQVKMKAEEWAIYRQRFPLLGQQQVFLSIDEYAYIGSDMRAKPPLKVALAYAEVFEEMLRHTDFIRMSAFTFGISTLDIKPTASTLNATGEVFKLFGEHFGAGVLPLPVAGDAPQPDPKYPAGFDHPQVKAGSPTYPLDMVAGLSPDRRSVLIAVVNPTFEPQSVFIALSGGRSEGAGTVWRLTGSGPEAVNAVGEPPGVAITEEAVPALNGTLTAAPLSAAIYRFPVEGLDAPTRRTE